MIQSFSDEVTARIWAGENPKNLPLVLVEKVRAKLQLLDAAKALTDLFFPTSNGFHKLGGKLNGWYAIKVDRKWRLIFTWTENGPANVALVDYH